MKAVFLRSNAILLKGLFTLLPITLTVYLLVWVTQSLEGAFGYAVTAMLPKGFYVPGLGLALALSIIFLAGLLVENYFSGPFVGKLDEILKRAPVIRTIYSPLKDLTDLFSRAKDSNRGQRVVFVQVAPGIESLGLVMRDQFDDLPKGTIRDQKVAVFIPFSYGLGGFTIIVDTNSIRDAGLPAERALQLAITGWVRSSRNPSI